MNSSGSFSYYNSEQGLIFPVGHVILLIPRLFHLWLFKRLILIFIFLMLLHQIFSHTQKMLFFNALTLYYSAYSHTHTCTDLLGGGE